MNTFRYVLIEIGYIIWGDIIRICSHKLSLLKYWVSHVFSVILFYGINHNMRYVEIPLYSSSNLSPSLIDMKFDNNDVVALVF